MVSISDDVREFASSRVVMCKDSGGVNQIANCTGYLLSFYFPPCMVWFAVHFGPGKGEREREGGRLTWCYIPQFLLDFPNQFPDMPWWSRVKGQVFPGVHE